MKVAALALLLVMAWAAPAAAQFTPTVVPFVKPGSRPRSIERGRDRSAASAAASPQGSGGWDGGAYLPVGCGYPCIYFDTADGDRRVLRAHPGRQRA